MKITKFEAAGVGLSIALMAVALYMLRAQTTVLGAVEGTAQSAAVAQPVTVTSKDGKDEAAWKEALTSAADRSGNLQKLVIEDIKVGTGDEVKAGDSVSVHYVGKLQTGEEFDSSKKRGVPFEFTVGEGRVIAGWEQGIVGMKVGGERILVIPPELAYGERAIGPIPPNSTLVFSIELLSIK